MENIKTSLITTVFNESENITRFLKSYKNQTMYPDEFIIVDGGSTDGTIKIIENFAKMNKDLNITLIIDKACSKKFIAGPIAKGRNIAINNTHYDYIIATDAGCILNEKWIEEIIKPFEDPEVDVVAGWYEAFITNNFQKDYANIMMPKLQYLDKKKFLPSSRSIAFKKQCWSKVGGYPTLTYTAEDTKYDLDMQDTGCQFIFTEKAVVYWDCPKNLMEASKKHYHYAFGDGQYKLFFTNYCKHLLKVFIPIFRKKFILEYLINLSTTIGYIKGYLKGLE